jgi:DNA-binding MarR family transcriptional regulator
MLGPHDQDEDLEQISRAVGELLRLNASRKVHAHRGDAADVQISPPAWALLRRIVEDGPHSLGALAEATHMDPAATGRQIRQLEDDGLVARSTSAEDGRVTLVAATEDGADADRRIRAVGQQHMRDTLASWSDDDRTELARLLRRFVSDMRPTQYRSADDGTS